MNSGTAQPRRGRPAKADAARLHDDFLDHSLRQFLTLGYRATTMDGLAAAFGASKSTIYRRYGSKARLLKAAMERGVPLLSTALGAVRTGPKRSVADVLRDFGAIIQLHHQDPEVRAMWCAVTEAREELAELGMIDRIADLQSAALQPVADYLDGLHRDGRSRVAAGQAGAACFSDMVSGGLNSFLGNPLREDQRGAALDFALHLFMKGIQPGG